MINQGNHSTPIPELASFLPAELLIHLDSLWDKSLAGIYTAYLPFANPQLALAAALIEVGIKLHRLDSEIEAEPVQLLLGDLCLVHSSRLLVEQTASKTQIDVARLIESTAALAAAQKPLPPLREELIALLQDCSR